MDWDTFFSMAWDNMLNFVIGTIILGTSFDLIRRGIDYLWNSRYRGWVLEVNPVDQNREPYTHELLWDEVRRFEQSRFEGRKFIQSVCSSEGVRLSEGEIAVDHPDNWVFRDAAARKYKFDFRKKLASPV